MKNKTIYLFFILVVGIVAYKQWSKPLKTDAPIVKDKALKSKQLNQIASQNSRKVASVKKVNSTPKVKPLIFKKREISSAKKIDNPNDLVVTNKFNPNWKEVTSKNILRNFKEQDVKLNLEHVKSMIFVKYNTGILAEKIKVELTLPSGKKSRYMALVDSETGSIINTWNRTRYEFRERLVLEGKGAEFNQ